MAQQSLIERIASRFVTRHQPPILPHPGPTGSELPFGTGGKSGALRAAVFGVNDGLVSNLSLVMGVAGAGPDPKVILLAGVAGLLAGASSMAAGEYISISTQREMFERQIDLEREELEVAPEEEEAELALIYRAKGIPQADAENLAHRLMRDK